METINNVVNYKKRFTRLTLSAILFSSLLGCSSKTVELKAKEFETAVNKDVSLKADTYLKDVKKDSEITFKSKIDNKKIGLYDVTIKYDDKEYAIKIKVVDKEKPVIALNKKLFVFDLNTTLKDVNKAINKEVKITDNYDKVFDDIVFIDKTPTSEKEIICKLKVKDASNNVSDMAEIKVQFTKDGKEKNSLKQEIIDVESTVNKKDNEKTLSNDTSGSAPKNEGDNTSSKNKTDKPSNTEGSNKGSSKTDKGTANDNGSNVSASDNANQGAGNANDSDGSIGGGNTEKPAGKPNEPVEPPRPSEQPKPDKPVQKPQLTVANAPNWMRNAGYIKLFNTDEEAYEWANTQIKIEGSPYFGMTSIVTGDLSDDENFTGVIWGVNIY